jgi:tRNA (guanine37-N1)-methyltransferase
VLTLFPEMFPGSLGYSLAGKALEKGTWSLETVDLKTFGLGKHRTVDDTPTGGGPGMVMRPDVLATAIDAVLGDTVLESGVPESGGHQSTAAQNQPLIYLSPRGEKLDQKLAHELKDAGGVTLICGRFEGVDERVLEARNVREISVGDYVLSGGEPAALVLMDAVIRLLPGVIGDALTLESESFESGLLEYPQYTKPQEWEGHLVPEVLLSGHHGKIEGWRRRMAEDITRARRPDLWDRYIAQNEDE